MMESRISRRTVLRGLSATIALPLLDAMVPVAARGALVAKLPRRMAFFYVPNGVHMQDWKPQAEGADFELPYILEPLKSFKDDMLVLTGLTQDKARPNGDGPGDHARSLASFLTGCQAKKTHGADIKVGVSVDQLAAEKVGSQTKFASLELGCDRGQQAGNCDSGYSCAYSSNISWKGESTPVAKEINPRLVFERLFGSGTPGADSAKKSKYDRSVLDYVLEDARSLKGRLGARDQRKLDEYLTSVREIEQRIARLETESTAQDPALNFAKPDGVPSDYAEHIRAMEDLMVLAFQGDITRISTMVIANEGSNRSYPFIDVPEGHHDLSHHGRDPKKQAKIREINRFHIANFAYFVEKLKTIREGDGTLLDNCMIVYGSGISDGNRHNHNDLPVLLVGRGGGTYKTGLHLKYADNTPLNNLYLSMLDRIDAQAETLGDSTGRLELPT
jgi:hypothetical protein